MNKREKKLETKLIDEGGKVKELLKPKNDIVFQSLFTQKNENITKNFISAMLDEEIESLQINDMKELFRERPEDKLGILDLEADINGKEKIDIEVQLINQKNLAERLLFYFSKLYEIEIQKGKDYNKAKKVVIVAIVDYNIEITKKLKQMETVWNLREKEHREMVLTDKIEICIIELSKVREEYQKDKTNEKAQWLLFLNNPNDMDVQEIVEKNENIKEATVEIVKMSKDEKLRKLAELRDKAIMDEKSIYAAGIDDGEKKGIKKAQIEIAKKLIKIKMPIEDIIDITGLSNKEIEDLY